MKRIASLIASVLVIIPYGASAATTLSPWDIYVISASSDGTYPGLANSNGFDFVSRVDLTAWTQIYFTDKGWDGTLGVPFWRSTTWEWAVRYTVPAWGLAAWTTVHYDDTMIPSLPSSGTSTWDMYAISAAWALTLSTNATNSFDLSTSGDNILVFQGSGTNPQFLYGVGLAVTNAWISSGSPTSNNSYIPAALSVAAKTIVNLGNLDNYQYNCSVVWLYAPGLTSQIAWAANWTADDLTAYWASPCVFKTGRPLLLSFDRQSPTLQKTNASSVTFRATFSGSVAWVDTSDFVLSAGSLPGSIFQVQTVSGSVYDVVITGLTSDGSVNLDLAALTDIANADWNPITTLAPQSQDQSYTIDKTAPVVTLSWASPISLLKNTSYADAGALWSDAVDGTGSLAAYSGSVNTALVGTYELWYRKTDTAWNISSIIKRTVNVVLWNAPVITLNGAANPTIEAGSNYIDAGAVWTDTEDGTGSLTGFSGSVDTAHLWTYVLDYQTSDTQGNIATAARSVIVADTTAPVVTLAGSAAENVYRNALYVDPGASWSDFIDGSWSLSAYSGSIDTSTLGSYELWYRRTDSSGNTSLIVKRTVTVVAGDSPIITLNGSGSLSIEYGTAYSDAWAQWLDSEDGSGSLAGYSGSVDSQVLGTYDLTYTFTDNQGNTATATRLVLVVDTTAPIVTLNWAAAVQVLRNNGYADAWANWSDAVDGSGSLVAYSGSVNTVTAGNYELWYRRIDAAGNISAIMTRTVTVALGDTPVISLIGSGSIVHEVWTSYTDQGAVWSDTEDGTGTLSSLSGSVDTSTPGTYLLWYGKTDSNGNAATAISRTVVVADTMKPVIVLNGANEITMLQWSLFSDPGAQCSDAYDLACMASATGTVNTSSVWTYVITYSATDSSGNSATPVLRTIHVVAAPVTQSWAWGGWSGAGTPAVDHTAGLTTITTDLTADTPRTAATVPDSGNSPMETGPAVVDWTTGSNGMRSCAAMNTVLSDGIADADYFTDTGSTPYAPLINKFAMARIISGNGKGLFEPSRAMTRAEFTKLVLAAFCYDSDQTEANAAAFADVAPDTWHARVIGRAAALGFVRGDTNAAGMPVFRPGDSISPTEASILLSRVLRRYNGTSEGLMELEFLRQAEIEWAVARDAALGLVEQAMQVAAQR